MDLHMLAHDWLWARFGALLLREDLDTIRAMIEQVVMEAADLSIPAPGGAALG